MTTIEKTIQKLTDKSNSVKGSKMPSLLDISLLLKHYNIEHDVPTKSFSGSKKGHSFHVYYSGGRSKYLDNTDSYYSMNSYSNSNFIINLINGKL